MNDTQHKRVLNEAYNRVHRQWPRVQIMLILAVTGVSAFLTSFVLLKLGITQMVVRYPIAILAAYGVFVMLIGVWLWLQQSGMDTADVVIETVDYIDPAVIDIASPRGVNVGSFGSSDVVPRGISSGADSGGGGIDLPGIDVDLDLDDAIWIVLLLVVVLAGLLAIFYIVWIAPVLLAEVLVDSLLAAGLYKTVKGIERRNWVATVLRKTALPAILALIFFSLAGFFVQKIEPDAASIGEAWRLMSK